MMRSVSKTKILRAPLFASRKIPLQYASRRCNKRCDSKDAKSIEGDLRMVFLFVLQQSHLLSITKSARSFLAVLQKNMSGQSDLGNIGSSWLSLMMFMKDQNFNWLISILTQVRWWIKYFKWSRQSRTQNSKNCTHPQMGRTVYPDSDDVCSRAWSPNIRACTPLREKETYGARVLGFDRQIPNVFHYSVHRV